MLLNNYTITYQVSLGSPVVTTSIKCADDDGLMSVVLWEIQNFGEGGFIKSTFEKIYPGPAKINLCVEKIGGSVHYYETVDKLIS